MEKIYLVENELKYAEEEFILCLEQHDERRWRNFVGHLEKSFTDLFEISKGTKIAKYAQVVMNRKRTDPLLVYIRESRNTIHHSSEQLTGFKLGKTIPKHLINNPVQLLSMTIKDKDGKDFIHDFSNTDVAELHFILGPVMDKNKKVILPPRFHLGIPINDCTSPKEVGALALKFYKDVLANVNVELTNHAK